LFIEYNLDNERNEEWKYRSKKCFREKKNKMKNVKYVGECLFYIVGIILAILVILK